MVVFSVLVYEKKLAETQSCGALTKNFEKHVRYLLPCYQWYGHDPCGARVLGQGPGLEPWETRKVMRNFWIMGPPLGTYLI